MFGMKTQTNNVNQLSFDFWTASPKSLGAMAAAFLAPARWEPTPKTVTPTPAAAILTRTSLEPGGVVAVRNERHPNATLEIAPGSTRRVIFHGESPTLGYVRIQFPGDTYANGEPRIQTLNSRVVTCDPF